MSVPSAVPGERHRDRRDGEGAEGLHIVVQSDRAQAVCEDRSGRQFVGRDLHDNAANQVAMLASINASATNAIRSLAC
jgi:hypothetical protein